jgi:hypothetical protein
MVLNLVDPSLYPLIFDRSRILPNETIGLDDCMEAVGKGELVGDPALSDDFSEDSPYPERFQLWSRRFQWMQCHVSFPDGENAKINAYINNLHPVDHLHFYHLIEQLITKSVRSWNVVLRQWNYDGYHNRNRIIFDNRDLNLDSKEFFGQIIRRRRNIKWPRSSQHV